MLPAQPNQSLIDGLACLQNLAAQRGSIGVRELARQLDLEPTRAHRLIRTLAHLGLAEQDADRRYRPGPGIHVLAAQAMFGSGLIRRALGPLSQLHELGLIVAMGVLWRDHVAYLYHGEPDMTPQQAIGRVGLHPADRSSIGKVLTAKTPVEYAMIEYGGPRRSIAVGIGEPAYAAVALSGRINRAQLGKHINALQHAAAQIQDTSGELP